MRVDFDYLSLNEPNRPGRRFEHFVAALLDVLGCSDVTFTGAEGISEEGADFVAVRHTELFPGWYVPIKWGVQCKCVEKPSRHKQTIESQLWDMVRLKNCRYILLVFATDPSDRLRKGFESWAEEKSVTIKIWGKSELDRFAGRYHILYEWLYGPQCDPQLVESRYPERLYRLGSYRAEAIRLVGAADESFPPETVHIIPTRTPYELPIDLQLEREKVIEHLKREATQNGAMFYDGPHTRLIDYRATPVEQTEQKHLDLTLGPIGWYDYSVVHFEFERLSRRRRVDEVLNYVNLDEVADGTIRGVRLSNILDTATTLVTLDGFALYSQRGRRVSASQGQYSSCVAENIHQIKDRSLEIQAAGELPAPFRTVLRGIGEELSPTIGELVHPRSILLLGLSFDLHGYHPTLLFAVMLPISSEEALDMCHQYPGEDFVEGQVKAVPAIRSSEQLNGLLSQSNWVHAGKASLIRVIEFLETIQRTSGLGLEETISGLVAGHIPR